MNSSSPAIFACFTGKKPPTVKKSQCPGTTILLLAPNACIQTHGFGYFAVFLAGQHRIDKGHNLYGNWMASYRTPNTRFPTS